MGNLPTGNEIRNNDVRLRRPHLQTLRRPRAGAMAGGDPDEQIYLMKLQTVINAIVLEDTIQGDW